MINHEIPSLAAGIIINESIVWSNGFGEQSDLDTVYMIGSITKTFTATAILQLNESNLVNIDEDINNYLPFDVSHPNYSSTPITIKMLLTHTAGLAREFNYSFIWYFDQDTIEWINSNFGTEFTYWDTRPSLGDFLNGSLNPSGPYYDSKNWFLEPGTQFEYSNMGFELLRYLIEQVTNQSIIDYVQENILNPLNMTNSGYNYLDFIGKNAIPYERIYFTNFELPLYNMNMSGAGSLRSTVPDLAKYLIAHMNHGEYNGFKLLNPETIDLMHQKYVSIPDSEPAGYGLGWFVYGDEFQGHDGATPGYLSCMYMKEREEGTFGIIAMFNRGTSLTLDNDLIKVFYPSLLQLLLERAESLFEQALIN
jgi:CubicO group peptidase (beta-lactamase class C family)